jgi:transmembrane sensor
LKNKIKITDLIQKEIDGTIESQQKQILNSFIEQVSNQNNNQLDSYELFERNRRIQLRLKREIQFRQRRRRKRLASSIAAALTVFLGFYFLSTNRVYQREPHQLNFATSDAIDSLLLSDGSMVYLKENSFISYPENFENQKQRLVSLSGEAFFKVTKNRKQPFIVKTKSLTTKVLGTSFGVVARASRHEVNVVTGKVSVNTFDHKNILYPNQKVVLTTSGALVQSSSNASLAFLWIQKHQVFEEETLENITNYLAYRFDKKFRIDTNELKNYRLKIRFENKNSLVEILDKIKFITSINYKIENNEVKLNKK